MPRDQFRQARYRACRTAGIPPPSLDARVQDLVAVMRAEGVDRAVIAGWSEGGTMAAFFAATYPERTEGLILSGTFASWVRRDDHPWAPTMRQQLRAIRLSRWSGALANSRRRVLAPSMAAQPGFRRWAARYERASISRSETRSVRQAHRRTSTSATCCHPSTLPRSSCTRAGIASSRSRAAGTWPSTSWAHDSWNSPPTTTRSGSARGMSTLDAMQEFLTGTRPNADHSRRLATVLFTDIVDSTVHAEQAGDAAWRDVLDRPR